MQVNATTKRTVRTCSDSDDDGGVEYDGTVEDAAKQAYAAEQILDEDARLAEEASSLSVGTPVSQFSIEALPEHCDADDMMRDHPQHPFSLAKALTDRCRISIICWPGHLAPYDCCHVAHIVKL
jgi:hypothetical protein